MARARSVALATGTSALVLLLAVMTALQPLAAALLGPVLVLAAAWATHPRATARAVALAAAAVAAALAVAMWPVLVLPAAVVALVVALTWRSPAWALVAAVLVFGFEGSMKIVLGLGAPLPAGNRALGAAALDLALFSAIGAIVFADRLRTPRGLWALATRPERAALILLGIWLALSVLQIPQGGDLIRGLEGFRLFPAYVAVALAAAIVAARPGAAGHAIAALLAIGLVVGGYATLRTIVGPADAERTFALSVPTVTEYGDAFRAVGSFSSAVGLISFLTPLAVFALALGIPAARRRRLAWPIGCLCVAGVVGSYGRAPLVAIALGLVFAAALLLTIGGTPRRKLAVVGIVAAVLVGGYGAAQVAGQVNPQLRERAAGILDPLGDESVRLRFGTWDESLEDVAHHPLGRGIGTVGGASASDRSRVVTTDNSFLKVLVEQGILGAMLFLGGLLGVVAFTALRLRRLGGETQALGLAALAGFVAFLGIAVAGEYFEQPGKVVAWGLLGIAVALGLGDPRAAPRTRRAG